MTLLLISLAVTLIVIALGVTITALRNGVSAPDEASAVETRARIAQQRRHSSQVQDRQRSY